MKTQIFEDCSAFLNREDKCINGVDPEFAKQFPAFVEEKNNKSCWNCSDCSGLESAAPASGKEGGFGIKIPIIENIHAKVLAAVSGSEALEMGSWHSCKTTHCRGGWVITLAGAEGKRLEENTSSAFAAMAIYHKSSPIRVSPVRFYESNEVARADIERCAKEEAKLK